MPPLLRISLQVTITIEETTTRLGTHVIVVVLNSNKIGITVGPSHNLTQSGAALVTVPNNQPNTSHGWPSSLNPWAPTHPNYTSQWSHYDKISYLLVSKPTRFLSTFRFHSRVLYALWLFETPHNQVYRTNSVISYSTKTKQTPLIWTTWAYIIFK